MELFDGYRYADLLQEYLATLNKYLRVRRILVLCLSAAFDCVSSARFAGFLTSTHSHNWLHPPPPPPPPPLPPPSLTHAAITQAGQRWLNPTTFSHLWSVLIARPSCNADRNIFGAWLKANADTEVREGERLEGCVASCNSSVWRGEGDDPASACAVRMGLDADGKERKASSGLRVCFRIMYSYIHHPHF